MKKLFILAFLFLGVAVAAQETKEPVKKVKQYFIYDMEDNYLKTSGKTKEQTAKKLDSIGLKRYKLLKEYQDGTTEYCVFKGEHSLFLDTI